MSAALTTEDVLLLGDAVMVFTVSGGQAKAKALLVLADKLGRLRHCDSCGVLFEGMATDSMCPHCDADMRHQEAIEARAGVS